MPVEPGDRVWIDYVGRTEAGAVFATSEPSVAREHGLVPEDGDGGPEIGPLSFAVGDGEVIDGLEEAVVGMERGEEATVTVPPEEAYGERDPDHVREYDRETFEEMVGTEPAVGLHVEARNDLHGDVTAIVEDTVEVDFNHELAGTALTFELRVRRVE